MSLEVEVKIHPTALVEKGAKFGVGVEIGPYTIVGNKVVLDDHVKVGSHCVLSGSTKIGAHSKIWPYSAIGTTPQDLKYKGEDAILECGERNMFREYSHISIGTEGGGGKTLIGNDNLFMVHSHVAHDCMIGSQSIIANGVSLGGHVEIADKVLVGGHCAIHQFCKIGTFAMLAGGAIVVQDVPPYTMVAGNHASPSGVHMIGMKRADFTSETITEIRKMYKLLYMSQLTLEEALARICAEIPDSKPKETFLQFLRESKRGICR